MYEELSSPVAPETAALHAQELQSFSQPGEWWTAAERTAMAAESRKERCAAGIQESIGDEALAESAELSETARRVIGAVALGGTDIDREYCHEAIDDLGEEPYVELVGVVARLAHLDVFARGVGIAAPALAAPVDGTQPRQQRPAQASDEGFFVASVPPAPAGGDLARWIYGGDFPAANILRSLSLVPDEARRLNAVMSIEYCSMAEITDMSYSPQPPLSRPQVEFVAARVSALNQCFY
ncbi:MAG: alkylhydroperoxidase-related (seleno)protein [Pseudomonadota bacterium]